MSALSLRNDEKNKAWNIRRLVNDSLGPSSQRTSVVYCKLTDFTSRLRFAIAAVCGGGGGSAARLQKITTLQNCPDWDTVKCEKRSISRQGYGTGNHYDIHSSWFMLLKQSQSIGITSKSKFDSPCCTSIC